MQMAASIKARQLHVHAPKKSSSESVGFYFFLNPIHRQGKDLWEGYHSYFIL